jgi:hypothetical protein
MLKVNRLVRRQLVKTLGSLPLVAHFAHRLQIGRIVDQQCPSRGNAHLTHGQVVLALLANRLTQPKAMYRLLEWVRGWAVAETFGFPAEKLNDDRIARCLDALAPQIDAVQGAVLVQAVKEFNLDLRQLHWDLTSVVLDGEFDPAAPPEAAPEGQAPYPQPAYGYGGVADQKQLRVGELVASDGSVPVFHRAFDGHRADVGTVVAVMEAVRQHVPLPDCAVIGDTKLLSEAVIWKLRDQHLHFLAPAPHSPALDQEFLSLPEDGWKVLDYCSQEQAKKPPEARTQYLGQEVAWCCRHPQTGAEATFRRLYVISSEERDTCRRARNRRLAQAAEELNDLLGKTGKGKLKTREAVQQRAEKILEKRKAQGFFSVTVRTVGGMPELTWDFDQGAIQAAERLDGYYVLLTSLPKEQAAPGGADPSALLRRWKQEWLVERRFHDWKGPLKVRPVFVTTPKRMAAFVLILHLALMLFCLLEREARRALAVRGQTKLPRLLAGHVDAVPTGANILTAFDYLLLTIEEGPPNRWGMTPLTAVQENLCRLLGVAMPELV